MNGPAVATLPGPAYPTGPELARIVSAWPSLPESIRRAVLALGPPNPTPLAGEYGAAVPGGALADGGHEYPDPPSVGG